MPLNCEHNIPCFVRNDLSYTDCSASWGAHFSSWPSEGSGGRTIGGSLVSWGFQPSLGHFQSISCNLDATVFPGPVNSSMDLYSKRCFSAPNSTPGFPSPCPCPWTVNISRVFVFLCVESLTWYFFFVEETVQPRSMFAVRTPFCVKVLFWLWWFRLVWRSCLAPCSALSCQCWSEILRWLERPPMCLFTLEKTVFCTKIYQQMAYLTFEKTNLWYILGVIWRKIFWKCYRNNYVIHICYFSSVMKYLILSYSVQLIVN